MKNPFKRKVKKIKLSEGYEFLEGLNKAVKYDEDREKYKRHFLSVVNKAEELEDIKKIKKLIEDNKKIDKMILSEGQFDYKYENVEHLLRHGETNPSKRKPIPSKKFNKFKLWFNKLKSKFKKNWEMTKEFGREIQYWLIAEYKIFTKLSYALNKKKDEINVRKAFYNNKSMFINKYGYDKGTHHFNEFSASINNGVRMHKRMEKLGM